MLRRLFLLLFLVIVVGGVVAAYFLLTPYAGFDKEVLVDIPSGTPTQSIARMLVDVRVIESEWPFLLARGLTRNANLQAGEYKFDRPLSTFDVYFKISRGEVYYRELTIPEGNNMFDIAQAVEAQGLMKGDTFLKVARNSAMIRDLAPDAPSLEGFLFPSKYRVTRRTTAAELAKEMTDTFRRVWKELGGAGDVNRVVTLASLVEKETGVPAERPTVASVYQNRLRIGMKLDCDPTTIYAAMLRGRYRGTIYRSDLDNLHPYNTYRVPGLPPGAIANPGKASLQAALAPAETNYLYLVARPGGLGSHSFSATLSQHNVAVQQYRSGSDP